MNKPAGEAIDLRPFFEWLPSSMSDAMGIMLVLTVIVPVLYVGYRFYHAYILAVGQEEEKPKRKNDGGSESFASHFELGDDGELIEVMDDEKPKRRED